MQKKKKQSGPAGCNNKKLVQFGGVSIFMAKNLIFLFHVDSIFRLGETHSPPPPKSKNDRSLNKTSSSIDMVIPISHVTS